MAKFRNKGGKYTDLHLLVHDHHLLASRAPTTVMNHHTLGLFLALPFLPAGVSKWAQHRWQQLGKANTQAPAHGICALRQEAVTPFPTPSLDLAA